MGEDNYPLYRRRDNDDRVECSTRHAGYTETVLLGNAWVVPYNPVLLLKYDAHINVEICATIRAVKYLHKYIFKGSDRTTIRVGPDRTAPDGPATGGPDPAAAVNEIDEYLVAR